MLNKIRGKPNEPYHTIFYKNPREACSDGLCKFCACSAGIRRLFQANTYVLPGQGLQEICICMYVYIYVYIYIVWKYREVNK